MRTAYHSTAQIDGRNDYLVRRYTLNQLAHANHVGHSVGRADFVEMYLFNSTAMRMGFCFSDELIYAHCALLNAVGQIEIVYHVFNVMHTGVMVMRVNMIFITVMMMLNMNMMVFMVIAMNVIGMCMVMFVRMVMIGVSMLMIATMFMMLLIRMVVMVMVKVIVFLHIIDGYAHMRAHYAAFGCSFALDMYARQPQRIHARDKAVGIIYKLA